MDEELLQESVEFSNISSDEEAVEVSTPITVEDIVEYINSKDGLEEEQKETSLESQANNLSSYNADNDSLTSLDIEALNTMSELYIESSLASVNVGANDYFDFISDPIQSYFAGVMANYPLNSYRAYHQRHWLQNSNYYSYYDDYYYLFYDYGRSNNYIELYKANGNSNYIVSFGSGSVANASIMYGSDSGLSDLRKGGFSHVEALAFLSVVASACVLYIVGAFFRQLRS